MVTVMKRRYLFPLVLGALVAATPVSAACFADYKAKRDNPLRLHYGVIELSDAACGAPARAEAEIRQRIARGNWELLNIVSIFGDEGLGERKESAGEFFLRF